MIAGNALTICFARSAVIRLLPFAIDLTVDSETPIAEAMIFLATNLFSESKVFINFSKLMHKGYIVYFFCQVNIRTVTLKYMIQPVSLSL